jgi:ABC-type glycerol-3-phosphate transport system permease component
MSGCSAAESGERMKTALRFLAALCALAAAILALGPIAWAISTSLKRNNEIFSVPPSLIPSTATVEHYARLIQEGVHWSFANSALYTFAAVSSSVALGAFAGYAFVRFEFRAKSAMLLLFMASMAIPGYALLLPTQILFVQIGLFNTPIALPVLYAAHIVPFAVWMTRAHFASVPIELEHAAAVDGYTRLEAAWRVVLPGAKPALIAAAAFGFLYSWNDYITSTTMIDSPDLRTLPVALIFFQGFHGRDWGALMAGAVIATLPPVVLFLAFRRYLIGGFSEGSVKG